MPQSSWYDDLDDAGDTANPIGPEYATPFQELTRLLHAGWRMALP